MPVELIRSTAAPSAPPVPVPEELSDVQLDETEETLTASMPEVTEDTCNVFARGCLVQMNVSVWTARRKLPESAVQGADPHFVRAHKFLVSKDSLKPIEQIRNEARTYVYNKTLPFPVNGVLFIPKQMIAEVDLKLKEYKALFDAEVAKFSAQYSVFAEQAREKLGTMYNVADYPQDISSKFGFSWRFFVIDAPGESDLLSPDLYAQEEAKFRETMQEFRMAAVRALRETFAEMVNRIAERLSDNKRFKDTTVENLKEFLNDFEKLNITDDTALAELVEKARMVITGELTAQDLRDDFELRDFVARKMAQVKDEIAETLVDRPVRRLKL